MASDRASKRGPSPLPEAELRRHCVSVRLNSDELRILDLKRGYFQRGEWLRMASIDRIPPHIPETNRLIWIKLSRSAANLNQIAHYLNSGQRLQIEEIIVELSAFRNALITCS
jgi:hypothetical protein